MNDIVTIRGFVATDVRRVRTEADLHIASFRMCSTERRFDRQTGEWSDGDTNWYTVSCFRGLAHNVGFSVNKGDRVVVTGRLKVRQWVTEAGKSGTSVEIDADALGHDLTFGVSNFRRVSSERSGESGADIAEDAAQENNSEVVDPDTGELLDAAAEQDLENIVGDSEGTDAEALAGASR